MRESPVPLAAIKIASDAEAKNLTDAIDRVATTEGRTLTCSLGNPAAAARAASIATSVPLDAAIHRLRGIGHRVTVLHPLPNIANHVVETEGIRGE